MVTTYLGGRRTRMTRIERIRTDIFPAGQLDFNPYGGELARILFCFRKNVCRFNYINYYLILSHFSRQTKKIRVKYRVDDVKSV